MTEDRQLGPQHDAEEIGASEDRRRARLAKMNEEPWGKFLLRTLVQLLVILAIGAVVFWLLGR